MATLASSSQSLKGHCPKSPCKTTCDNNTLHTKRLSCARWANVDITLKDSSFIHLTGSKTMTVPDTPSQAVPSRWLRIIPILLLHAATFWLVFQVLTTLAFGSSDYCRHANIEIPATTLNVIILAERCFKFSIPIFCLVMMADAALMVTLTSWNRSRRWPLSAFSQIFMFVALVFVAYAAVWLGNPIFWAVP